MNLNVKMLFLILFAFTSLSILGQEPCIHFNEVSHYMGTFPKSKGKVSHRFNFVNTCKEPVLITHVKATCGCTATQYERKPIPSGGQGYVTVTFDPARFAGYFSKKVSVFSSAQSQPTYLTISGRIRVNHQVNDAFTYFIGDLKSDKELIDFGDVEKTMSKRKAEIKMINIMRDSIYIEVISSPAWMSCELTNECLTQGDNTRLMVGFRTDSLSQWGSVNDYIKLKIKRGVRSEIVDVPIIVNMIDAFSDLSVSQKKNAPKVFLIEDTIQVRPNKSDYRLTIYNKGLSNLLIRNAQSNYAEVAIKKYDQLIKPGKKGSVVIGCNKNIIEVDKVAITLWSNDPDNYRTEVYMNNL